MNGSTERTSTLTARSGGARGRGVAACASHSSADTAGSGVVDDAGFWSSDRPHLGSQRLVLLEALLLEDQVRSSMLEERGEEVVVGVDGVAGEGGLEVCRDAHEPTTERLFVSLSLRGRD